MQKTWQNNNRGNSEYDTLFGIETGTKSVRFYNIGCCIDSLHTDCKRHLSALSQLLCNYK